MPIEWSEPRPPTKDVCHYDHVVAQTPLGEIRLEWKGWKDHDSPCGNMPWGEFIIAHDLDDAKAAVQEAWNVMAPKVVALATR